MKRLITSISGVLVTTLFLISYLSAQPQSELTVKPEADIKVAKDLRYRPVEASHNEKVLDLRLNPPEVLEVSVRKIDEENALLQVRFAIDKRLLEFETIPFEIDGEEVYLKDATSTDDEQKGVRVYSGKTRLDVKAIAVESRRLLEILLREKKPVLIRKFQGRELIAAKPATERIIMLQEELERFSRDDRSEIHLFALDLDRVALQPDPQRTLIITHPSVVNDSTRTSQCVTRTAVDGTTEQGMEGMGKWTFGYLMQEMANQPATGIDPSQLTLHWLQHWTTSQGINGFEVPPRGSIDGEVIAKWPKLTPPTCSVLPCADGSGRLDLSKAPMKLLAIVNRIDLAANLAYGVGSGGEARFVFAVMDGCTPRKFTVIMEYGVPHHRCKGLREWAQKWLDLENYALGTAAYNAHLEAITEQFAARGVEPIRFNGSALNQLRTNEIHLGINWELREFQLGLLEPEIFVQPPLMPTLIPGYLKEVTVKQTPDRWSFNSRRLGERGPKVVDLATWVNNNALLIKEDKHTVPLMLPAAGSGPFRGGHAPNDKDLHWDAWNGPANTGTSLISDSDVRHHFSINTCNGCHGGETHDVLKVIPEITQRAIIPFVHINPIPTALQPGGLSDFLSGQITIPDPAYPNDRSKDRTFDEIAVRQDKLVIFSNRVCISLIRHRPRLVAH